MIWTATVPGISIPWRWSWFLERAKKQNKTQPNQTHIETHLHSTNNNNGTVTSILAEPGWEICEGGGVGELNKAISVQNHSWL